MKDPGKAKSLLAHLQKILTPGMLSDHLRAGKTAFISERGREEEEWGSFWLW
jgi:hypothetical protein